MRKEDSETGHHGRTRTETSKPPGFHSTQPGNLHKRELNFLEDHGLIDFKKNSDYLFAAF